MTEEATNLSTTEGGRVGCAETGSREPSPSSTGLGPTGFDPARYDLLPCEMRATGEALSDALMYLQLLGGFVRGVSMEAVCYCIEFQHPNFDGCNTQMLFMKNVERGEFSARIQVLGPTASAIEACSDATPKSDAAEGESAVGNAETPNPSSPSGISREDEG
jgi:hypothetical protein